MTKKSPHLFPTTAGLRVGMQVRFVLDYAEGQPIIIAGTIAALSQQDPHRVTIIWASDIAKRIAAKYGRAVREQREVVDTRRIREILP